MAFVRDPLRPPAWHEGIVQFNEFLVLDHLRSGGPLSRTQLARDLNLSAATVGRIVSRLMHAGSVREVGPAPSTNGRRPTLVEFNPRSGTVIAVDVGGTNIHAAVADLGGSILWENLRATHQAGTSPLEALSDTVRDCLAECFRFPGGPMAAAIGVPAIVDRRTGVLGVAPNVGWEGLDLAEELRAILPIPLLIENDVNLAAEAHAWRGQAHNVADFVVLSIGTGIGGAVVSDGRLLHGSSSAAGEVGYLVPDRRLLGAQPRLLGPWEAVASGPAIAARAKELLDSDGSAQSALTFHADDLRAEHVFRAAADGDSLAASVVDEFIDWLAIGIADITAVVDPELVILDGGVARSLQPILPRVEAILAGVLPKVPRLVASTLGPNATVVGAIAAAIRLGTSPERGKISGADRSKSRVG